MVPVVSLPAISALVTSETMASSGSGATPLAGLPASSRAMGRLAVSEAGLRP